MTELAAILRYVLAADPNGAGPLSDALEDAGDPRAERVRELWREWQAERAKLDGRKRLRADKRWTYQFVLDSQLRRDLRHLLHDVWVRMTNETIAPAVARGKVRR